MEVGKKRPLLITILGIFFAIDAIGIIITILDGSYLKAPAELLGFLVYGSGAAIIYLVIVAILFILSYTFIKGGMRFGWMLAIAYLIFGIINVIATIPSIPSTAAAAATEASKLNSQISYGLVGFTTSLLYFSVGAEVVIYLLVLYYLTRPKPRAWLGA